MTDTEKPSQKTPSSQPPYGASDTTIVSSRSFSEDEAATSEPAVIELGDQAQSHDSEDTPESEQANRFGEIEPLDATNTSDAFVSSVDALAESKKTSTENIDESTKVADAATAEAILASQTSTAQTSSSKPDIDATQGGSKGPVGHQHGTPLQNGTSVQNGMSVQKNRFPWLALLGLLISLGVAGVCYWLWQKSEQDTLTVKALQEQLIQLQAQAKQIQSNTQSTVNGELQRFQSSLREQEQALQSRLNEVLREQDQLQQRLDGQQKRLSSLTTTRREDWLLAEAEYLLRLANQRVVMERTTDNVLALLRSADERLQQVSEGTGDAELFAVRKSINRELAALEKIAPVDKEGLYLRLYALAESIESLPRLNIEDFHLPEHTTNKEASVDDAQAPSALPEERRWWQTLWSEMRAMVVQLDRYVRIDRTDAPSKPLIDSYATQMAGLNVQLLLEQAQLAVLQAEGTIYQQSLEKAQDLLGNYYAITPQRDQVIRGLKELQQVDIAPELPDISASFNLLRDYQRQQHRVQPAPKGQL